jgi:predicted nucleotidyltransferase
MLENVAAVARRLQEIGIDDVVFVGGATIELLVTDPAAPPARPTVDVDLVTPVASRSAFYALEAKLRDAGHRPAEEGPICRWTIDGIAVDVMPPVPTILGFSNRWYGALIEHAMPAQLADGTRILIGDAPHTVATKLEAFRGRGEEDLRFSRDVTDVVTLVDGREELGDEIGRAPGEVRRYVGSTFARLVDDPDFIDAVSGHLSPDDASQRRAPSVVERMRRIARQERDS